MSTTTTTASFSIAPLLKHLDSLPRSESLHVPSDDLIKEIAAALSAVFTNDVSTVQTTALLTALTFTRLHHNALVVKAVVDVMRQVGVHVVLTESDKLNVKKKSLSKGRYNGGLVDIVGTGGDGHNTFNVSTTAALLLSPHVLVCKHGNRASTSTSGAADLLNSLAQPTDILALKPADYTNLLTEHTNFAFLYAPTYQPGMKHVAPIRKELGFRTIFNVIGPLVHPVENVEARLLGVGNKDLGPLYIESLRLLGAQKGMVVCGLEGDGLDEISPAGRTACWRLVASNDGGLATVEQFELDPTRDFGLPRHNLADCKSGTPDENAKLVMDILHNRVKEGNAVLDYCLINAAALLVVAELVDDWKEGVKLIKSGISNGSALEQWQKCVEGSKILLGQN